METDKAIDEFLHLRARRVFIRNEDAAARTDQLQQPHQDPQKPFRVISKTETHFKNEYGQTKH